MFDQPGDAVIVSGDLGRHGIAILSVRESTGQIAAVPEQQRSAAQSRKLAACYLEQAAPGQFDIVYSWGVLHHTGDMMRAIRVAAGQVRNGGLFAVALYGKTRYCGIWTRIKRWYVHAPLHKQAAAERLYIRLFGLYLLLRGKRLSTHIANYYSAKRGMDFHHDVRDWIGGYPYESIAPRELIALLEPLGFVLVRQNVKRRSGLFGSGNDEYVFRKPLT